MLLPDHHHQTPGRPKRPPDVGECSDGVAEEHRAEPAKCEVETFLRERVRLSIGLLEDDVSEPLRLGELAGTNDHPRREVDSERAPLRGQPGCVPGRLARPTADVQDLAPGLDVVGTAQHLVVPLKFGVVVDTVHNLLGGLTLRRALADTARPASFLAVVCVHHGFGPAADSNVTAWPASLTGADPRSCDHRRIHGTTSYGLGARRFRWRVGARIYARPRGRQDPPGESSWSHRGVKGARRRIPSRGCLVFVDEPAQHIAAAQPDAGPLTSRIVMCLWSLEAEPAMRSR